MVSNYYYNYKSYLYYGYKVPFYILLYMKRPSS